MCCLLVDFKPQVIVMINESECSHLAFSIKPQACIVLYIVQSKDFSQINNAGIICDSISGPNCKQ